MKLNKKNRLALAVKAMRNRLFPDPLPEKINISNPTNDTGWAYLTRDRVAWDGTGDATDYLDVGASLSAGVSYEVSLSISDYTGSGLIGLSTAGGISTGMRHSGNTAKKETFTYTSGTIQLFAVNTCTANIRISIRQV